MTTCWILSPSVTVNGISLGYGQNKTFEDVTLDLKGNTDSFLKLFSDILLTKQQFYD